MFLGLSRRQAYLKVINSRLERTSLLATRSTVRRVISKQGISYHRIFRTCSLSSPTLSSQPPHLLIAVTTHTVVLSIRSAGLSFAQAASRETSQALPAYPKPRHTLRRRKIRTAGTQHWALIGEPFVGQHTIVLIGLQKRPTSGVTAKKSGFGRILLEIPPSKGLAHICPICGLCITVEIRAHHGH